MQGLIRVQVHLDIGTLFVPMDFTAKCVYTVIT